MPDEKIRPGQYQVRPDHDSGEFKVVNKFTGEVHAKGTTRENAEHQRRLLYAVGHGWKPTEGS